MKLVSSTVLVASVALVAAVVGWLLTRSPVRAEVRLPSAQPGEPPPVEFTTGTAIGMSGCMATACHGGPATPALTGKLDANVWQSSGSCWVAADPHARAYDVLVSDKPSRPGQATAKEMMAKLGGGPAHEDVRCLACHTNPTLAEPTTDARKLDLRREGVSCESCHGNAGGWLREHTTGSKVGLAELHDIGARAKACVGCHVGAPAENGFPARDMNHDMIAAGHPRLDFDFAEYLRRLPKHWHEGERGPAFESRVWLVGRVAQAEAACALLADRADRAMKNDPRTPWPEFAEFNCAACHHDIPQDWRANPAYLGKRSPGSLAWQTIWPVTTGELADLKPLLEVMNGKRAGPGKVLDPAKNSAARLTELRGSYTEMLDADVMRAAVKCFPKSAIDYADWDAAGQMLHGLAALERSRVLKRDPDEKFVWPFAAIRNRNWPATEPELNILLVKVPCRPKEP